MKAYCVKCGKKVDMVGGKRTKTKSGADMMKGKCPKCGSKVCVFVAKK